jgi:ABC-type phosphate/phosphonate transport system substrate-binding protein
VAFAAHLAAQTGKPGRAAYRATVGGLIHARGVIEALSDGRIDVGPLDSYYHDLLKLHEPALAARVRVIDSTAARPIPPLVATAALDPPTLDRLRAALRSAADRPELRDSMAQLLLTGFAFPAASDYAPLAALGHGLQLARE